MKDPLHGTLTPYEVLGVPIRADKKTIDEAFKKSIASGRNPGEATEARNTLSKAEDRTIADIFIYHEPFVRQLSPDVWDEPARLLDQRAQVAEAWSDIHKKLFPHHASAHSLAVLWYWWAMWAADEQSAPLREQKTSREESSRQPVKDELKPGRYSLPLLWSNTIAYWVFLISSEDFWKVWAQSNEHVGLSLDSASIDALRHRLSSHFDNLFHSLNERYGNSDNKAYQRCRLTFNTEMKTARQLIKAGVRRSRNGSAFPVCCGRLLLEQVGILEEVQAGLEDPSMLSAHKDLAVLIESKKYDEALQAIESLPVQDKKSKEVLQLSAKAYLEKGKQLFKLNQFDQAFESWHKALATNELRKEVTTTSVDSCKSKAASLRNTSPEAAMEILEKALKAGLGKDSENELKPSLAEILIQRAIGLINAAQSQEKESLKERIAQVEKGIALLERALSLGSKDAAKNIEIAKSVVDQLKMGPEVVKLVQEANSLANREEFDEAISLLRKALSIADSEGKKAVGKILAQFLNASAVKTINGVSPGIAEAVEKNQEEVRHRMNQVVSKKKISPIHTLLGDGGYLVARGICFALAILGYSLPEGHKTGSLMLFAIVVAFVLFAYVLYPLYRKNMPMMHYEPRYGLVTESFCDLCWDTAKYTYTIQPAQSLDYLTLRSNEPRKVSLCSKHSEELRSISNSDACVAKYIYNGVHRAVALLEEAVKLDSSFRQAKENLRQAKETLSAIRT